MFKCEGGRRDNTTLMVSTVSACVEHPKGGREGEGGRGRGEREGGERGRVGGSE